MYLSASEKPAAFDLIARAEGPAHRSRLTAMEADDDDDDGDDLTVIRSTVYRSSASAARSTTSFSSRCKRG